MTLIGRLGATPEAIKDKQGRDLLVYSVATLDRAQVNSDGCEFLEATPAKTGRRCCSHDGCPLTAALTALFCLWCPRM